MKVYVYNRAISEREQTAVKVGLNGDVEFVEEIDKARVVVTTFEVFDDRQQCDKLLRLTNKARSKTLINFADNEVMRIPEKWRFHLPTIVLGRNEQLPECHGQTVYAALNAIPCVRYEDSRSLITHIANLGKILPN